MNLSSSSALERGFSIPPLGIDFGRGFILTI
jgi:hypothetical protein